MRKRHSGYQAAVEGNVLDCGNAAFLLGLENSH
jgi:hypothetical protein